MVGIYLWCLGADAPLFDIDPVRFGKLGDDCFETGMFERADMSNGSVVTWLVQQHFDPTGEHHGDDDAEALVDRVAPEFDTFGSQVGHGGVEVVAHERDLMSGRVTRVDTHLGGWQGEDEPPVAAIDVIPTEDVG